MVLISVLLSAQCTDVNVNNVTKDIYPKYYKPEHFVKLERKFKFEVSLQFAELLLMTFQSLFQGTLL